MTVLPVDIRLTPDHSVLICLYNFCSFVLRMIEIGNHWPLTAHQDFEIHACKIGLSPNMLEPSIHCFIEEAVGCVWMFPLGWRHICVLVRGADGFGLQSVWAFPFPSFHYSH